MVNSVSRVCQCKLMRQHFYIRPTPIKKLGVFQPAAPPHRCVELCYFNGLQKSNLTIEF